MKILYITQYFYPEVGATTNRALANVRYLSKKGHNVKVLTEMPNHPKGIIFDGYKKKIFLKEKMEHFSISRVWVFTSSKKNFVTRMLFYLSFMFMGIIYTLFNWKKYDVIYVTSPPLFVGVIGIFLKKIFPKTKFVFEVRDLWPDVAIEMGELKNPMLISMSKILEKKIYEKSELIISLTKGIYKSISSISPEKSKFIPNGVDIDIFKREKNIKSSQFIVVYAGHHGLLSGMDLIIEAANILRNEDIFFYFVGDGPLKTKCQTLTTNFQLEKVQFYNSISLFKVSEFLSQCSVGISSGKKINLVKYSIPVKMFGYMACELPVILSQEGESVEIINKARCGISSIPENATDLAKKILWMKNHPKERIEMGIRGRKFVEKYYNREKQAEILELELLEIMNKS
ncbi:MAG: glycosyltransferase family 4 protein [Armatimonadetes bacterium]|nr:glycosyltransferase family 4 protein [Armatimonadota bacterium]